MIMFETFMAFKRPCQREESGNAVQFTGVRDLPACGFYNILGFT